LSARASGINFTSSQYRDLFEQVGLLGREKDKVKQYSHGMKQRLGLAQALIHNPSLIILDEPNTGLDPQGIIDLRKLMLTLNKEHGKTILFSSHILSEVEEICNSLVVINKGNVVVQGKVSELLSYEKLNVILELNDINNSKSVFYNSEYKNDITSFEDGLFHLTLSKSQIPALISTLTNLKVEIVRIDYRNQLEDYFLKITHA
jgi:ABC-2 type transport system ATP-binding protein